MKNEQMNIKTALPQILTEAATPSTQMGQKGPGDEGVLRKVLKTATLTTLPASGILHQLKQLTSYFLPFTFYLVLTTACNNLTQEPAPAPDTTALAKLVVTSERDGSATFSLATLGISRAQPFTLSSHGFKHGRILVVNDTGIAYRASMATSWAADSGTLTLCQQGHCRERLLLVRNFNRVDPVPLSCMPLPSLTRLVTASGATFTNNLPGMAEAGAQLDSIWGFMATAAINSDATGFTYAPTGSNIFPNVAANDEVFYRVRRPNNLGCYQSSVRFFYPDSCTYMLARKDAYSPASLPSVESPLLMQNNDRNCAGATIQNAVVRLTPQSYTSSKRILTKNGKASVTDTSIAGTQQFYYHRLTAGPSQDTLTYYLIDENELRISRAIVIITLP